jgi:hypothetical protein
VKAFCTECGRRVIWAKKPTDPAYGPEPFPPDFDCERGCGTFPRETPASLIDVPGWEWRTIFGRIVEVEDNS